MTDSGSAKWLLVRGDARRIPLGDRSVHCVCTSPPFFGLRDYGTGRWLGGDVGCDHGPVSGIQGQSEASQRADRTFTGAKPQGHQCSRCGARRVDRQIGLEPTPGDYVEAIVGVFREVWRVLRDDGVVWLNLGDSYANDGKWGGHTSGKHVSDLHGEPVGRNKRNTGLKPKDLIGIPHRVALALQADGWYWRAAPPWLKANPMPESVVDRPTTAHETILLLTKGQEYFYDAEAVRKPHARLWDENNGGSWAHGVGDAKRVAERGRAGTHSGPYPLPNPDGRNRRTADWFRESLPLAAALLRAQADEIDRVARDGGMLTGDDGLPLAFLVNPKPFSGAHFAVWPVDLVEPMIRAGTSEKGCCPKCGAPYRRVVEKRREPTRPGLNNKRALVPHAPGVSPNLDPYRHCTATTTSGWAASCECNAGEPVPCVVFDPFSGAGTTPVVSLALNRHCIGLDLNPDYHAIARRRIERPHARPAVERAGGEPTPLFDLLEGAR